MSEKASMLFQFTALSASLFHLRLLLKSEPNRQSSSFVHPLLHKFSVDRVLRTDGVAGLFCEHHRVIFGLQPSSSLLAALQKFRSSSAKSHSSGL